MRRFAWFALLLLTGTLCAEDLGFDVAREPRKAAEIFCAREGFLFYRMRMPDGTLRQVERDLGNPGKLRGFNRWSGTVKGDVVKIRTDPKTKGGPTEFTFRRGRAVSVKYRGKVTDLTAGWKRPRYPEGESPLYACMAERVASGNSNPDGKWQDGRLGFPYENPNQSAALYAGLGVLALGLLLSRRRAVRVTGMVLAGAFAALLFLTASRGGLLAFFFGALPVLGLRYRAVFTTRWFWPTLCGLVIAIVVWMLVAPPKLVTRGSSAGRSGWSNRMRLELWSAAPKMMADAPGGWRITPPGIAYVDWYQPERQLAYTGSLMNDHLTRLVSFGRLGRIGYVLGWSLLLVFGGIFAWRTWNGVTLGSWIALGIAAWFNPVTVGDWSFFVWLPALAATLLPLLRRDWLTRRIAAWGAAGALGLTSAVLLVFAALAQEDGGRGGPSVRTEERRVTVNGTHPSTWIVDDGYALGGLLYGHDMRSFYRQHPSAQPVGYVKRVADLPAKGIRRLVLAGRAGDDFLRASCSDPSGPRGLPEELIFVSPPFPPAAIPPAVLQRSRVRLYVGEFATWYTADYANPPAWVRIIPGASRYLPDWMTYATEKAKDSAALRSETIML